MNNGLVYSTLSKYAKHFICNFKNTLFVMGYSVHYFKENILHLYNPQLKKFKKKMLNCQINTYAESISNNNYIIVVGGAGTKDVYEYTFKMQSFQKVANISEGRYLHALILREPLLYSIGGYTQDTVGTCEKYNIRKDKWEPMPSLSQRRRACAAFISKNRYIYAIAGFDSGNVNTIEKLDLLNTSWKQVKYTGNLDAGHGLHSVIINEWNVILFGNSSEKVYTLKLSCIGKISISDSMIVSNHPEYYYWSSHYVYTGKEIYSLDCRHNLHIFNIQANAYEFIDVQQHTQNESITSKDNPQSSG